MWVLRHVYVGIEVCTPHTYIHTYIKVPYIKYMHLLLVTSRQCPPRAPIIAVVGLPAVHDGAAVAPVPVEANTVLPQLAHLHLGPDGVYKVYMLCV